MPRRSERIKNQCKHSVFETKCSGRRENKTALSSQAMENDDFNATMRAASTPKAQSDMEHVFSGAQYALTDVHTAVQDAHNMFGEQGSDHSSHQSANQPQMGTHTQEMAHMFQQMAIMQRQIESTQAEMAKAHMVNQTLEQRVIALQAQAHLSSSAAFRSAPHTYANGGVYPSSSIPPNTSVLGAPHVSAHAQAAGTYYPQPYSATNANFVPTAAPGAASMPSMASSFGLPLHNNHGANMPVGHGFGNFNTLLQKPYELPEFTGNVDQWPVFIAAYRQSTAAFGYSPLQNLFRLQKCLKGTAKESVQYLLTDPNNIESLLEDLQFRFGRPELLIHSQTNKVREFKAIDERQIERFIAFSSLVQNMVAFLNKDASRHVLSETALMVELVSKLPPSKQLQWAEHALSLNQRATAIDFSAWLKKLAQCVTILMLPPAIATTPLASSQRNTQSSGQNRQRQDRHVLRVDQASSATCGVCNKTHKTIDCSLFKGYSVADRWAAARQHKLCFGCLRGGHTYEVCRSKQRCSIDGCDKSHHALMHKEIETVQKKDESQEGAAAVKDVTVAAATTRQNPFDKRSTNVLNCRERDELPLLFRVIPVTLYGPQRSVDTFALLDEGSALTMLECSLADELGLSGPETELTMQFVGTNSSTQPSQEVTLGISGIWKNATRYTMNRVRTAKTLNLPMQTVNMSALDSRHRHLRGLPIYEFQKATPRMLIGLEHADLGVPYKVRMSATGGPIAYKTKLGWVVFGRQGHKTDVIVGKMLHCQEIDERYNELQQLVKEHYSTESFGVKCPERILESDDDNRAREILKTTTVRNGDRFQTGLLWKTDEVALPKSFEMAKKRLSTTVRKMNGDDVFAQLYREQIDGYLQKGYARKLSPEEAQTRDNQTWYLPHFGVQSIHKPGKLRLVFDAAATVLGTSLNSCLLKGPDMNEPMLKILFQFRMRMVGVCGDIAEMFHQVLIQPSDRRSQRFLWYGESTAKEPDEYEMNVMTFGATCSPTSAQFVKNINGDEFADEFPEAAKAIRELHYVDDYVASYATELEAIQVTKDVTEIHRRGGFTLRKFISSSPVVLAALSGDVDGGSVDMQLDAAAANKILGMKWHTDDDAFYFNIQFPNMNDDLILGRRAPTKRELLSATMSIFNPFGFLCEFLLPAKLMLQDLWRTGIGWDEPVPATINDKWQMWRSEIMSTARLRIPRCYSEHLLTSEDVQLHVFADASELAFSAVAYWRIGHAGRYEVAFIAGKTRCAPLKQLSVPRLELQAAVLATRMTNTIRDCHKVNFTRLIMWSDSRTVLHWIRSEQRRYKPFVAHRVAEIVDTVGFSCWRWIPTKQNVADDATRVPAQPHFDEGCRWLRGPAFLLMDESGWPKEPDEVINLKDDEEIRTRFVGMTIDPSVVKVERFSNYLRLCRTIAWVLRFINNMRISPEDRRFGELDAAEIQRATTKLFRLAQIDSFPNEYETLSKGEQVGRSSSLATLMPYIDGDGVMRLYGRTDLADVRYLPEDAQRPILLPKGHRITELMVHNQHVRMGHQFEDGTICAVRQRFWVPHLRTLVRRVKNRCQTCKIRASRPKTAVAGQLPIDRLTPYINPFTYTGLDFFGPVSVTVGRRREKRWIALFTCLTIRAVHMEVAQDLSSDACILCIRNFCNIRGVPTRIRSDCGTNFVGADGEIRNMTNFIDADVVGRELTTKGIDWKFNCPANPEAGGVWERLVQSAKRVLQVTLKEAAPHVETLRSLVIEAANIINSRPLTHIPVSPADPSPITPNHFLIGRTNSTTVPVQGDNKQLSSRKQWRVLQQLNNQFWRQWVRDYLPELTRRTKHHEDVEPITKGCLVMVCDANRSRNQWERGRVEKVVIGTDGRVRTAHVRTAGGVMRRPVSKLALLDVESSEPAIDRTHGARDVADLDEAEVETST